MKNISLFIVLSVLVLATPNAKAQNWLWARSMAGYYGISNPRIVTDIMGNAIMAGNGFIAKYNSSGSLLWQKDATNGFEGMAIDVCTDASGNIFVTGSYSATITLGTTVLTNVGNTDIFIAKYDASGALIWARGAGGAAEDDVYSIATDELGNICICGDFRSLSIAFDATTLVNNPGENSLFLVRYNSSGSIIWAKAESGGAGISRANSVAVDNNGNIFVAGMFASDTINIDTITLTNSTATTTVGDYPEIFVARYDTSGNVVWAKSAGGDQDDYPTKITKDALGNSYVTGVFNSTDLQVSTFTLHNASSGSLDAFLISYDISGNVRWAKSIGGTGQDFIRTAAIDNSGNLYVAGGFSSATITIGTTTLYNTVTTFAAIDMMIAKYNSTGTEQWATRVGGTAWESAEGMATDNAGDIYICGLFSSDTLSFGAEILTKSTLVTADVFITKLNGTISTLQEIKSNKAGVLMYPNPTKDKLVIIADVPITNLVVRDIYGREVYQCDHDSKEIQVSMQKAANGVYLVIINGNDVGVFIKE